MFDREVSASVITGGVRYEATTDKDGRTTITMDGAWAGDGVFEHGRIDDCSAILHPNPDECERIYELLDSALRASRGRP